MYKLITALLALLAASTDAVSVQEGTNIQINISAGDEEDDAPMQPTLEGML